MWLRPLGILILSMPKDTQSIQLCATIDIPNNIYSVYSAVQNGEPRQYISTTPLQPITPTLLSGRYRPRRCRNVATAANTPTASAFIAEEA